MDAVYSKLVVRFFDERFRISDYQCISWGESDYQLADLPGL
jgi:hypothetical protein